MSKTDRRAATEIGAREWINPCVGVHSHSNPKMDFARAFSHAEDDFNATPL
jgi:hypothetical protein